MIVACRASDTRPLATYTYVPIATIATARRVACSSMATSQDSGDRNTSVAAHATMRTTDDADAGAASTMRTTDDADAGAASLSSTTDDADAGAASLSSTTDDADAGAASLSSTTDDADAGAASLSSTTDDADAGAASLSSTGTAIAVAVAVAPKKEIAVVCAASLPASTTGSASPLCNTTGVHPNGTSIEGHGGGGGTLQHIAAPTVSVGSTSQRQQHAQDSAALDTPKPVITAMHAPMHTTPEIQRSPEPNHTGAHEAASRKTLHLKTSDLGTSGHAVNEHPLPGPASADVGAGKQIDRIDTDSLKCTDAQAGVEAGEQLDRSGTDTLKCTDAQADVRAGEQLDRSGTDSLKRTDARTGTYQIKYPGQTKQGSYFLATFPFI